MGCYTVSALTAVGKARAAISGISKRFIIAIILKSFQSILDGKS